MAAHQLMVTLIFRLLLPLLLGICAVLRFSLMNFAYLILLMMIPFLPTPTYHNMKGHTGRFLKAVALIGVITFLMKFTFQMVLLSMPPYGAYNEHFMPYRCTEVNFNSLNGTAVASSTWKEGNIANKAFENEDNNFWHAERGSVLPQSIWYDFREPIFLEKFAFKSRTDKIGKHNLVSDGPSNFTVFGSNDSDCSNEISWVQLYEDSSGNKFSIKNDDKRGDFKIEAVFRCYGIQVHDVPGRKNSEKHVTISRIRFYNDTDEINFKTINGTAGATSVWKEGNIAKNAFSKRPPNIWHSEKGVDLPQFIWYQFPKPLKIVKYSFMSRKDEENLGNEPPLSKTVIPDGPSRYEFFGSNDHDCTNQSMRVTLYNDSSGLPFNSTIHTKIEEIDNDQNFQCYGFRINDVPGISRSDTYVSVSRIRLYTAKGGYLEELFRHLGFARLDAVSEVDGTRWLLPECLLLVLGPTCYLVIWKLVSHINPDVHLPNSQAGHNQIGLKILNTVGTYVALALIGLAGVMVPSFTSAIYFGVFMVFATYWSLNNTLGRRFGFVCRVLMVQSGVHVVLLYIYQHQVIQELPNLKPKSLLPRLFGMTAIVKTDVCGDPRSVIWADLWSEYFNPILLLAMFYFLAYESDFLLSNKAALLAPSMSMDTSVRYLIRRSTFKRRSLKSCRSNMSESGQRSRRTSSTSKRRYPSDRQDDAEKQSKVIDGGLETPLPSRKSRITSIPSRRPSMRSSNASAKNFNTIGANGSLPSKLIPRYPQETEKDRVTDNLHVENPTDKSSNGGGVFLGGALAFHLVGGIASDKSAMRSDATTQELEQTDDEDEGENPLQKLIAPLISVFQLIIRSSYIATNIVMMAWSITYHSWFTFILLLWACVLWMIPNQRAAMLRCSPALVIYAEFLLIIQYVYCLDLTDEELPIQHSTINLKQVGLVKETEMPVKPIFVKTLYTCMFWITLRQYVQEVLEGSASEMSTAAALQPFTVAVSTTTSGGPVSSLMPQAQDEASASPVMQKVGQWVRGFLVKFWIWVVAILLFVFGIQGSEVVIFRIMYMVLFLIFVITFQLSYSAWRKFLYGFWLTVIIYQMLVLVLTYTYQFENFPSYLNYTGIPEQLQHDIGLEVYETGRLFIKLMTPTFFVIVTIIQVHYFHNDFLELSDIEKVSKQTPEKNATKTPSKPPVHPCPDLLESCTLNDLQALTAFYGQKVINKLNEVLSAARELGWRFLEIHIINIVLGSVMMLACYDVCVLHFVFAILATVAVPLHERIQIKICQAIVVIASLLLIVRMIYQIEYIDPSDWAADCTLYHNETATPLHYPLNTTADNAIWVGLKKVDSLPKLLKGYIGIIVVITIQAVIGIRQHYVRSLTGLPPPPTGILFPNVTRYTADDGMIECIKYMFNYGFYKFGLEVCLMSLVGVIGTRLDVYSLFYAGWLCYFFNRRRKEIANVWKPFTYCICVMIPLQYLICIGMPPAVCMNYPWLYVLDKDRLVQMKELREWLFFPDFEKPPMAYKIVTDFCLLVFAVCQQAVFDIELSDEGEMFEGGSNREIVYDDPTTLVNPIPDFVTYTRNYLDMVKVVVFFTSYWITLAVMFLSGTNRVTLFAMGYVLGSFIFLWLGNEFYLKPLSTILRLWNHLLGYNVAVIVIKTFLQMLGCVCLKELAWGACWFVQLLGIACVKKFGDKSDDQIVKDIFDDSGCAVPKSEAGLMWDGICFGFLLMQRRLFSSFYFQHLVTEMKAQTKLASRGAELIAELMMKEIAEKEAAEREVLNKIKEKMERIKATQQIIQGKPSREPSNHYEG